MNTTVTSNETEALKRRAKALALLEEAVALDGLKPFCITHRHQYGHSSYLLWAATAPSVQEAATVLDAEFEPEKGEELYIELDLSLVELAGISVTTRLPETTEEQMERRIDRSIDAARASNGLMA